MKQRSPALSIISIFCGAVGVLISITITLSFLFLPALDSILYLVIYGKFSIAAQYDVHFDAVIIFYCIAALFAVTAIILGIIGLKQRRGKRGLAIAGIATGSCTVLLPIILLFIGGIIYLVLFCLIKLFSFSFSSV